jgi:hypothetical protein
MSNKTFLREYIDGSVLIKVWEFTWYDGKKYVARTIHPRIK